MVSNYGAYDLYGNSGKYCFFFWGAFCTMYIGLLLFLGKRSGTWTC